MVRVLIALLALFSLSADALTIGAPGVGTLTVCGMPLSTTNLIQLNCRLNGANSNCSFRKANTSAGYTPSGSNKFRVKVLRILTTTGSATSGAQLLYSNNDVGYGTATSFTSPIFEFGISGNYMIPATGSIFGNGIQEFMQCETSDFLVLNAKFPGVSGDGTNTFSAQLYGYEEP